jgi:hypothetical protein
MSDHEPQEETMLESDYDPRVYHGKTFREESDDSMTALVIVVTLAAVTGIVLFMLIFKAC